MHAEDKWETHQETAWAKLSKAQGLQLACMEAYWAHIGVMAVHSWEVTTAFQALMGCPEC